MSKNDSQLDLKLRNGLLRFEKTVRKLPGVAKQERRDAFIRQLIDSIHRVHYVAIIGERDISARRKDPKDPLFDPLRAAILFHRDKKIDEAFWLVFLSVHFGKNKTSGWRLVRDVFGALGSGAWTWTRTRRNPAEFRKWLAAHEARLKGADGIRRGFGNHRKYQSLDAYKPAGTGAAVETYVEWVMHHGSHEKLVQHALMQSGGAPRATFDFLYKEMQAVASFGRMARFDYLTMLGKLGFAKIEPGSTYMQGATGPLSGARLLFGGSYAAAQLDDWLIELGAELDVGMQVIEDAVCNWQKTPDRYKQFRG